MSLSKWVMHKFYREADGQPEKLPWHRDKPEEPLVSAVEALPAGSRALDVGCGAGVFSAWLAGRGLDVTALDMIPEAIEMARARLEAGGHTATLICGDLFAFAPEAPFDLVYDSGCLHSLIGGDVAAYKAQLLRWQAPDGHFVLEHWGKRHALDWRPIGPRRRSQTTIERTFAPEWRSERTKVSDFDAPLPFGPVVRGVGYWFRHGAT